MQFKVSLEQKNQSGIYIILNTVNSKFYVGSAVNLRYRATKHKNELLNGVHCNSKLQRFVNKYGIEVLHFNLLELCAREKLIEREQFYLDFLGAVENGFNFCPTAESVLGRKHGLETKRKMSLKATGRKMSPESIEKSRQFYLGRKLTPEHIRKATAHAKGKKRSAAVVEKVRAGRIASSLEKGILINIVCPVCKKEFQGYPRQKTCSLACYNNKPYIIINQINKQGQILQSFNSVIECSRQLKLSQTSVVMRCIGQLKKPKEDYLLKFGDESLAANYQNRQCETCSKRFYDPNQRVRFCSRTCIKVPNRASPCK